jgi:hypothetical protein
MKWTWLVKGILLFVSMSVASACARKLNEPTSSTKAPTPVPIVEPATGAVGLTASGVPAIAVAAAGSKITHSDVREYVLSHPLPGTIKTANVTIVSTTFLPNNGVSTMLHTPRIGVSAQEAMCVVVLSGQFTFSGPPKASATFPIAVEVFDARTGHLMQYGGLSHPPRPPESTR